MSDHKLSSDRVVELLRGVRFPGFPRDIVTLGLLESVQLEGDRIGIALRLPGGRTEVPAELVQDIEGALKPTDARIEIAVSQGAATSRDSSERASSQAPPSGGAPQGSTLEGVRAVLAVASAKGGVGKSTVATNLACAFAAAGLSTGLLDADVYGPSLPLMMDAQTRPIAAGGRRFHPVDRHGVRCMSMGFFLDDSSPVIWRGPMVAGLVRQFLEDCVWGNLDVLVVDLPPGTGDAQLTLAQQIRLSGAVIVTTPQQVALRDVERGVAMFRRLGVPILGVIENMSSFRCPHCGSEEHVFGTRSAGAEMASAAGVPLLARLPLEIAVRTSGDSGRPVVLAHPESESARAFAALAARVAAELGVAANDPAVVVA